MKKQIDNYFDIDKLRFASYYKLSDKNKNINLDNDCINYNLVLNKYIDYKYEFITKFNSHTKKRDKNGNYIPKKDTIGNFSKKPKLIEKHKLRNLDKVLKCINNKKNCIIKFYKNNYGYQEINTTFKTISNLIIGHGEVSFREVSIKLDHIYGVPFIPASSLKGAFRNYLKSKYSLSEKQLSLIFGSEEKIGQVIFLDIYPKKYEVGIDIMTPHFGQYYSNNEPPTDDLTPVPIKFPVIKKDAIFDFIILYKEEKIKLISMTINIEKEFEAFLENNPLGAKTSVNYGYFEKVNNNER